MTTLTRPRSRARGTAGPVRTFLMLFVVSLAILVLRNTDALRATSVLGTAVIVPLQTAVASAGASFDRVVQAIGEIEKLRADNARYREENEKLLLENVRLREQMIAAQQSAKLDATAKALAYETVAADVIARDPGAILQTLVVAGGTDRGVALGNVVLSDQGVVGRVSEVGPNYAKVQLVTDSSSVVSALVQGSRATGLVRGQYGDSLVMDWILQTEPVKVDDIVLTAGLATAGDLHSLYPKGLVLGRVVQVQKTENSAYMRAVLLPAVDLRKLERVLIVKG